MGKGKVTIDHDEIRNWIESMRAQPARVRGTERDSDDAGLIRIDFPDGKEERLETITWEQFFDKFEERKLALIYEPGIPFSKFVRRETVAEELKHGERAKGSTKGSRAVEREPKRHASDQTNVAGRLLMYELNALLNAEVELETVLLGAEPLIKNKKLRQMIKQHAAQTAQHGKRIEMILSEMNAREDTNDCKGMLGLLEEMQEALNRDDMAAFGDELLVDIARKIENYEIAAYQNLIFEARKLGRKSIVHGAQQNLKDEQEQLRKLNEIHPEILAETEEEVGAGT